jgi:hypothetical protein
MSREIDKGSEMDREEDEISLKFIYKVFVIFPSIF